ncbi:MAG: ATPase [Martelella sp.]|uniref:AAA family ATPase n=1 Tax=unclassified Martelella TaxID=2629616 RepID=UPI000C653B5B|nr:ATP-binding protein [Martelella sp.]MAU20454.1 ATPase [Martelella sp.]
MLTRLLLENWKSYEKAELNIDPLTILIGTNAGGKSNALDALSFLNRTVAGLNLTACLSGDANITPLRGGTEWASRNHSERFKLGIVVQEDSNTDYEYSIEVFVSESRCEVSSEELIRKKYTSIKGKSRKQIGQIGLFRTDTPDQNDPMIKVRLYNKSSGTLRQLSRSSSVLSQLITQSTRQEISDGLNAVGKILREIFILDPIPSHMRYFAPLSESLEPDAGNIAGVISALPEDRQREIEETFAAYLSKLPERDIKRVYAERVGKFKSDAMLYCEENWVRGGETPLIDARGMSDGTLRFLAILTALLTRPTGSLLVIEEVDNGLHPSRAYLLIDMLRKIGEERRVDIVVTTHNPALLDALGPSSVPFITVAHRDSKTGASKLTLLENIDNLARVLGHGPLGSLSTKGIIERALKGEQLTFGF